MRLDPEDSLPIPDNEDTAAVPAGLVYSAGALMSLGSVGNVRPCLAPLHNVRMRTAGRCWECGDFRYPDADEREQAPVTCPEHGEYGPFDSFCRPCAMSHDAGRIAARPENTSERRLAYELTSEGTKAAIRDELANLLTTHRWGHKPLEQTVDAAVAIVLDTVSA